LRFGAQTAKIDTFYAINNCGDMWSKSYKR
jgi:hypothetical protein